MSPLYTDRVAAALKAKSAEFKTAEQEFKEDLESLQNALNDFEGMSAAEVEAALVGIERAGARPTREQDDLPMIVPFGPRWTDHRQAREWAAEVLAGVTTYAVDGSQITPRGDLSIPVGVVQIGWFANPHDANGAYIKDVQVEVLSPGDLRKPYEPNFPRQEVEWRRYLGETQRAIEFMEAHAGQRAVTFHDGTLTVSFIHDRLPYRQRQYVEWVNRLISTSEKTGIPAVAYVDASYATDLTTLLTCLSGKCEKDPGISDAALLRPRMAWGDRCQTFLCDRDDDVEGNAYYDRICFTYLKTTQDNAPARLEIPRWVFEAGPETYQWVLDVVRAECVVGLGYPYALETADAAAVLTLEDREHFYRLFQEFASQEQIQVRFSRKSMSKRGRR